jgi:Ca2+-binding RTX toxin-like protein
MSTILNPFFNIQNIVDDSVLELDAPLGVKAVQLGGKTFVYVAGRNDNGIAIFEMAADGTLIALPDVVDNATLELDGVFQFDAVTLGGSTYLLATGFDDDGVNVFEIDPTTGALTNTDVFSDSAITALNGASGVANITVGARTFVVVSGFNDSGVSVFEIDNSGILSPITDVFDGGLLELAGAQFVETVTVDGTDMVIVAGTSDSGISVFEIDNTGALTSLFDVPDGGSLELSSVLGLATFELGGTTYLYAAGEGDSGISVFTIAGNGVLTNIDNVPSSATNPLAGVSSVEITTIEGIPFLMANVRDSDALTMFVINPDGTLGESFTVFDSGDLELDFVNWGEFVTIGEKTFYVAAGSTDDGLSVFEIGGADDALVGTNDEDVILGRAGNDDLLGLGGRDQLFGGEGSDVLVGRQGADTLHGGEGADVLVGGGARDIASYEGSTAVTVDLRLGTGSGGDAEGDRLIDVEGLVGGAEGDTLLGDGGQNRIRGGDGDDIIEGRAGRDDLVGGADDDILYGGSNDDILQGSNGNDILIGGEGDDLLLGQGNRDTFVFEDNFGTDTIGDFNNGREVIDFSQNSVVNDIGDLAIIQLGSDVLIAVSGSTDSITVQNQSASDFAADDFVFAV